MMYQMLVVVVVLLMLLLMLMMVLMLMATEPCVCCDTIRLFGFKCNDHECDQLLLSQVIWDDRPS